MEFKFIIKKLNKSLSKKEEIIFDQWYNESVKHRNYFENVKENYSNDIEHIDVQKGWEEVNKKIGQKAKKVNLWKYAVAASIALIISFTFIFNDKSQVNEPTIVNNNIETGTDKATLTLEDGLNIILEKGRNYTTNNLSSNGEELVYDVGNNSKAEIAYNYLTIPRGGQFFVKLSDGTQVWLNSESKLKYPVKFIEGQTREVQLLYGEAYFDVSPSANHNKSSFKVSTLIQEIEVLGTEFNIKAYRDESYIYTTLVEGVVSVDNTINKEILKPNEQSVLNIENNNITITEVDVYNATSWKKGIFSFNHMPLKKIAKVLSRWYDTEIVFANSDLENIPFTGVLNKNQKIEEILLIIKNTNNISYEINNTIVTFK